MSKKVIPILPAQRLESFQQCPRRAWLEEHKPELAQDPEDAAYWQLQAEAVKRAARRQFKGAFTVYGSRDESLEMTKELMGRHAQATFFDASFVTQGIHFRPDVLETKSRGLIASEITASTLRAGTLEKDKHARLAHRLSVSAWGLARHRVKAMQFAVHGLDRDEAWDGVDPTYQGLLTRVDMTDAVLEGRKAIAEEVADLRAVLASKKEPKVKVTRHCKKPFPCPFAEHCKAEKGRPALTIYDIPGKFWLTQDRWASMGYYDLKRIPQRELDAAPAELQPVLESLLSGKEWKSKQAAKAFKELPFPRYYFDFEAISLALPAWKDRRPYEQVPFQWSVHIETAPGVFTHKAFIELTGEDPAKACASALIRALGKKGPVLVYHASYEGSRLKEMAERYPAMAKALLAIRERLVDLELWVREYYYHPDMKGSYSIKKVLPCLAPEFSYDQLEGVKNGVDAQLGFISAVGGGFDKQRYDLTRQRLLNYCAHDTWAMVVTAYRLAGKKVPARPADTKRPAGTSTFNQARLKKAHASHVWTLWEQQLPARGAAVQWATQD